MAVQQEIDKTMVHIERGPNIINLNTYVTVAGFLILIATSIFGWGFIYAGMQRSLETNGKSIEVLDTRVSRLEASTRALDNHELRLSSVEQQAAGSALGMKALEGTLNNLGSDVRVVKEILMRIEGAQHPK